MTHCVKSTLFGGKEGRGGARPATGDPGAPPPPALLSRPRSGSVSPNGSCGMITPEHSPLPAVPTSGALQLPALFKPLAAATARPRLDLRHYRRRRPTGLGDQSGPKSSNQHHTWELPPRHCLHHSPSRRGGASTQPTFAVGSAPRKGTDLGAQWPPGIVVMRRRKS